ncbi:MAG: OsmC family protein [Chloroflexota bacterium]
MAGPVTETSLRWAGGTIFQAEGEGGAQLQMDVPAAKGGGGVGFSPMQLLLQALAGCMSVTVVQILAKQRVTLDAYDIHVWGERAEEPPSPYTHIVVEHRLRGEGLAHANLMRIVQMVEEKYCSVAATLPHGMVEHIVVLDEQGDDAEARGLAASTPGRGTATT